MVGVVNAAGVMHIAMTAVKIVVNSVKVRRVVLLNVIWQIKDNIEFALEDQSLYSMM